MNVREYNRAAWDRQVERGNQWTIPVSRETVAAARRGEWKIFLTPEKPAPRSWFPSLKNCAVLCLAASGGQQAPLLAAAGAHVTVLDNSPKQLAQDRCVAEREGLQIQTVEGDMADLHMFADHSFDLIVHPCSNVFVPEVRPVWREAYRVLRRGGVLLAGFVNPVFFIFDDATMERGEFHVRHTLPYSDLRSLDEAERQRYLESGAPLEFGHTLDDQIGGQIAAGFVITGFLEDKWKEWPLSNYTPTFIMTRASKL